MYPTLFNQVSDQYCAVNKAIALLPSPTDEAAANQWANTTWNFPPITDEGTITFTELGLALKASIAEVLAPERPCGDDLRRGPNANAWRRWTIQQGWNPHVPIAGPNDYRNSSLGTAGNNSPEHNRRRSEFKSGTALTRRFQAFLH